MNKTILVYEIPWLIEKIYEESDKLISEITYTNKFEERCIQSIGEYLALDERNKYNKTYLLKLINRKVKEFKDNYMKEEAHTFSELSVIDESGEEIPFDPIDVLADVESEVIAKETTALLAQDDRRKKVIVECWTNGNRNASEISRELAYSFGGNPETHRKFVQRFQKLCRNELSTAI